MLQIKSNAPEIKWIIANASKNDFARSLDEQLIRTGNLTEKQVAAVTRQLYRPVAATIEVGSVLKMQEAFASAIESGLKRPKMRLSGFMLKLAPATGRNKGAIYVTSSDEYLGKIADGAFTPSRDCPADKQAEIVAMCADPLAAAVAYGRETGQCACCGRELTDPDSIALGVGPICRAKWGM
jgi:hypothetical protein